jgi:hypothetical protein
MLGNLDYRCRGYQFKPVHLEHVCFWWSDFPLNLFAMPIVGVDWFEKQPGTNGRATVDELWKFGKDW